MLWANANLSTEQLTGVAILKDFYFEGMVNN